MDIAIDVLHHQIIRGGRRTSAPYYEVETLAEDDRLRYTILAPPPARPNHARAAAEKAAAKPTTKPRRGMKTAAGSSGCDGRRVVLDGKNRPGGDLTALNGARRGRLTARNGAEVVKEIRSTDRHDTGLRLDRTTGCRAINNLVRSPHDSALRT
jgi:hypothetical protein